MFGRLYSQSFGRTMKVLTAGEHAATLALLSEQSKLEGSHDIMEAQPLSPSKVQSSTIANAEPVTKKSRQVRRAEARRQQKDLRKHMNEHVNGKNRKR